MRDYQKAVRNACGNDLHLGCLRSLHTIFCGEGNSLPREGFLFGAVQLKVIGVNDFPVAFLQLRHAHKQHTVVDITLYNLLPGVSLQRGRFESINGEVSRVTFNSI